MPLMLGKKPAVHDSRTLCMLDYLPRVLPDPLSRVDWASKVTRWPMMLNDRLGTCGVAGPGHAVQQWTTYAQPKEFVPNDAQVLKAYSALSGYSPVTGKHDDGVVMMEMMNYWRQQGIGKHKILGYVSFNPRMILQTRLAIQVFGNAVVGLLLPKTSKAQVGKTWKVPTITGTGPGRPGTWGGHCVLLAKYNPDLLTCVTWGALQSMTWGFFHAYCDEAFAAVSKDWVDAGGLSPSGFDLPRLLNDVQDLEAA